MNKENIICGKNSVLEAIENDVAINKIYASKPLEIKNKNIKIKIVSKHFLDTLTTSNHQGVVAILEKNFSYSSFEQIIRNKPNIILILDHIEDNQNLGAILRVANGCGTKDIIMPKERCAQINDVTLKVSSGGFNGLNIARVNSLQVAIEKLKENNYWIYTTAIDQGQSYIETNYNFPMVLVVGNEAKGVSKTILNQSDQNIYIPMKGTVQSLNVAVATGILLFEITKNIE